MQRFLVSNQVVSIVAIGVYGVKQKLWGLVRNPHINLVAAQVLELDNNKLYLYRVNRVEPVLF